MQIQTVCQDVHNFCGNKSMYQEDEQKRRETTNNRKTRVGVFQIWYLKHAAVATNSSCLTPTTPTPAPTQ